jgi:hypothetical protein
MKCVTLHWLDCSKWIVERHDQYHDVANAIVGIACWQCRPLECFTEFVFGSLHSGVSLANGIGDEGAKALGDALKGNTTLTSLSLDLYRE